MKNKGNSDKLEGWFIENFCPKIEYQIKKKSGKKEKNNLIVALGSPSHDIITSFLFNEFKPSHLLNVKITPKTKILTYYIKGEGIKKDYILADLYKFENVLFLNGKSLSARPHFLHPYEYLNLYNKVWKELALFLKKNYNIENCIRFGYMLYKNDDLLGFPISKCEKHLEKLDLKIPDNMAGEGGAYTLMGELSDLGIRSFEIIGGVPGGAIKTKTGGFSKKILSKLEEILNLDLRISKFEEFEKTIKKKAIDMQQMIFGPKGGPKPEDQKNYYI